MGKQRQQQPSVRRTIRRNILTAAIMQAVIAGAGQAATIVVNDSADVSGGSNCSLRDAVASAKADAAIGGCDAGAGPDKIAFSSGVVPGTITLTQGQLVLDSEVSVIGPGPAELTISGNNSSRIFALDDGNFAVTTMMSLSGLTLRDGSSTGCGGAVTTNGERVSLTNLVVAGNSAMVGGGLCFYAGTNHVTNSEITGNEANRGGGIGTSYRGDLTISGTTIAGNTSTENGAGIDSYFSKLRIVDSTLSGNVAGASGGGLYHYKGIAQSSSYDVTMTNVTVSGNTANSGGGLHNEGTFMTLTHTTVANNSTASGGAVDNRGTLSLINSVLADSATGADCVSTGSSSAEASLVENGATCEATLREDPGLGILLDNGGPTRTHHPAVDFFGGGAENSVLIDAASATNCAQADQRGFDRIERCDIGAVEGVTTLTVNTLEDVLNDNDNQCSLRDAIARAEDNVPGIAIGNECGSGVGAVFIDFAASITPGTINLASGDLDIRASLQINGPGADQIIVSANNASGVFRVNDGLGGNIDQNVTIEGITISGGNSVVGGGIRNDEMLTLDGVHLTGNTATNSGGAIHSNFAPLIVRNSTIDGNSASNGGGLDSGESTTIINSTISGNTAASRGGGLNADDRLIIRNSTLANNSGLEGGALHFNFGTADLYNTILADSNSGGDCFVTSTGLVNANLYNVIEDGSCSTFAQQADPGILELTTNGGPTLTHRVSHESIAINAGDQGSCELFDQRGLARDDGACDLGATEFAQSLITVNTLADVTANDGQCSLREAFWSSNNSEPSGAEDGECSAGIDATTITFDPAVLPGTINLVDGELSATSIINLRGSATKALVIDAGGSSRVLDIDDSDLFTHIPVSASHVTITGGNSRIGAGIYNRESFTLESSTVSGNVSRDYGGALSNIGPARIINSTLSGNSAGIGGGAICNYTNSLTLINSTIIGNTAPTLAAGLDNYTATATLRNTIIAGNFGEDCTNLGTNPVITAGADNIIQDGTCPTDALAVDPLVGPLGDNGGPTETHALLAGSPAIDAGDQNACSNFTFDQTGMDRTMDGDGNGSSICDIGAYELADPNAPVDSIFEDDFGG